MGVCDLRQIIYFLSFGVLTCKMDLISTWQVGRLEKLRGLKNMVNCDVLLKDKLISLRNRKCCSRGKSNCAPGLV